MSEIYLHPARRQGGAPSGTILVSDTSEDDDSGVALIAVDPAGNTMSGEEKEALAAEICKRFNSVNKSTKGPSNERE